MIDKYKDKTSLMCFIDENKSEFFVKDRNDFSFLYSKIDQLRATNSSIITIDDMGKENLLKAKSIKIIYLRNREQIIIRTF